MLEVAIGIVTAAVFTNEPFTLREFAGAVLIISAGLTEFARMSSRSAPRSDLPPPNSPSPSSPDSPSPRSPRSQPRSRGATNARG